MLGSCRDHVDHVGRIWRLCWACVDPLLGPSSSHVDLMLKPERRVPFNVFKNSRRRRRRRR